MLDKVTIMAASLLISSTIFTASIFSQSLFTFTSLLRAWNFAHWGCQVFAFVTIVARVSRYMSSGLLIVSHFCKVFFPHFHEGKLLALVLVLYWLAENNFSLATLVFHVSIPGCLCNIPWKFWCSCYCCTCKFVCGYYIHRNHSSSDIVHYHVRKGKATPLQHSWPSFTSCSFTSGWKAGLVSKYLYSHEEFFRMEV